MQPSVTSRPTTLKILIVDDDEGVTQTFARMLRLEGYQVRTAINAEKGLQEAERSRPDAIILDLRMPLVDGLGFLRRLRASDERSRPSFVSWALKSGSSRSGWRISSASRATF